MNYIVGKNDNLNNKNKELFQQYLKGNLKARDELIIQNMALVTYIVSHNFSSQLCYDDMDDFISIGTIGLIKAIDTFDSTKNYSFATYATRVIFNEVLMYLRKCKKWNTHMSLQQPIKQSYLHEEITLEETLADDTNFVEEILTNFDYEDANILLSELNEKEQEILKYYFGFYPPRLNQRDIAKKLNLSQSYISRIIKSATCKLQKNYNLERKKSQTS